MAITKVNKNIDFLVDEHGNLVGARNPKSQTSVDENYADTYLVAGKKNPVTGRIKTTSGADPLVTQVKKVMMLGDSMFANNNPVKSITSATRSGGVVSCVSNGHGFANGQKINAYNFSDPTFWGRNVVATVADANNYSYAAPGPDGVGAGIAGLKPMLAMNLAAQTDAGLMFWLKSLTCGGVELVHNAGYNGNTSADMLARLDAELIAGADTEEVIFLCGYNDFVNESRMADAVFADVVAISKKVLEAGKTFKVLSALPWTTGGSNAIRAQAVRYNKLARAWFSGLQGCRFIDAQRALLDPASATAFSPKSGLLNADGIHWAPGAAKAVATQYYNDCKDELPTANRLVNSVADTYGFDPASSNINDFGPFSSANTAGVATGWSMTNSSTTTTPTVVLLADGSTYGQQMVMTPGGSNCYAGFTLSANINSARWVPGDTVRIMARIDLSNVAGSNFRGFNAVLSMSGFSISANVGSAASAALFPQADGTILLVSNPIEIPPSTTFLNFYIRFIFDAAGTAMTAVVSSLSIDKI